MKKAILVVSFGTSYKDTRKKTIDACENKIKESFEGYDFYRAYTSKIIINKLKKRDNIEIDNPTEVLNKLYNNGYEEVVVQSLHIICGDEYNKLKDIVSQYEDKFTKISLGRPLLTYVEDYRETILALKQDLIELDADEAVVFMGHGIENESHPAYLAIESMLRESGINAFVGMVFGYPKLDQVIKLLKESNIRTVNLMPLMLVAGNHVINDMAGDKRDSWKTILELEGFNVKLQLKGLGENTYIQEKFKNHALDCMQKHNKKETYYETNSWN